jgi:selenocysteine lyase/cysteine desulfurase
MVGWLSFEGTDDYTNLVRYADRLRADARRFEVGTVAFQDLLGMTVSLGLLEEIGIAAVSAYTRQLADPLLAWADANGVRITSPRDGHRTAIVCVAPPDPVGAFRRLREAGVVCVLREGAIRLSPHCYNTPAEMEKVVDVLDSLVS